MVSLSQPEFALIVTAANQNPMTIRQFITQSSCSSVLVARASTERGRTQLERQHSGQAQEYSRIRYRPDTSR
jgi:hypothetical protein